MTEQLPPGQSSKSLHPAHVSTSSWVTWRVWRKKTELSTVLKCCDGKNATVAWFQGREGHIFTRSLHIWGKKQRNATSLFPFVSQWPVFNTLMSMSQEMTGFSGQFCFQREIMSSESVLDANRTLNLKTDRNIRHPFPAPAPERSFLI